MSKKHKAHQTRASSQPQVEPANISKKESQALQELQEVMVSFSQDLPLAQMFAGMQDEKQLAKMMAALSGILDSLPIETLTQGLLNNPKEEELLSKEISNIFSGLKHLTETVNKHVADEK
ncbi:hypothetical protein [Chlamydia sp.]|uniref:hypothetical protein n=1 Tax=Chlamydia sp. TaxID=35827 RepID=UPI0025C14C32|nr:hypothetical protein [Chlamydia sp.]MBQ8498928.1 hypothetical protein [Chlamydia sp.]